MLKRLKTCLLIMVMAVSIVSQALIGEAQEYNTVDANLSEQTGYKPMQRYYDPTVPLTENDTEFSERDESDRSSITEQEKVYGNDPFWARMSSSYYYNQMNTTEKSIYDQLNLAAYKALVGNEDVEYIEATFDLNSIEEETVYYVAQVFAENNTQYYFLSNWYTYYSCGADGGVRIRLYPKYQKGEDRQKYTAQFRTTVEGMLGEIAKESSVLNKEKKAHDLIANKVSWSSVDVNGNDDSEDKQNSDSVIFTDSTVCAGYAAAFQLLCNASGIETISVTSNDHEWNQVRFGDKWYVVDVTWDDSDDDDISYNYLNVSDTKAREGGGTSHTPEEMWEKYNRPACLSDAVEGYSLQGDVAVTGIQISQTDANLYTGDMLQLYATPIPNNASSQDITWSSSDSSIASIDVNGLVTTKKQGDVTIYASLDNGKVSESCSLIIRSRVSAVSLNYSQLSMNTNSKILLTATVTPTDATATSARWYSSDPSVVSVSDTGEVTAISKGEAVITYQANSDPYQPYFVGDVSSTCSITVTEAVTKKTGPEYDNAGNLLKAYDANGNMIKTQFYFDGAYTYFLMDDGSPMKNRITYHPDGVHIIYFDVKGHEIFNAFQYCPSDGQGNLGYTCFFDSNGYLYKDQITFINGNQPVYLDAAGRWMQNGWFYFANGRDLGYAESNGILRNYGWGYDPWGRTVYYHWNGMVARGLISDGVYYYSMDMNDGHLLGKFR